MACIAGAQTNPPIPVPDRIMPIATPLLLEYQVGATVTAVIYAKQVAIPNNNPWVSWNCQSR
jgi:hypothetical protein